MCWGITSKGQGNGSVTKGSEENQTRRTSKVRRVAISDRVIREGLPQNQASEQRPGESEGNHHAYFWKESIPGKRKSKCEDPEAKLCLACQWSRKEAMWAEQSE